MTHPSLNSIVERLPGLPDDHEDFTPDLAMKIMEKYREIIGQRDAIISELQAELEQKNTPLTKQELPGAERSGCETAIEIVARIIDPERWAVLDGYLAETKRKYRGQNVGYDLDAFKDKASMAKASAILACPEVARAFGGQR